MASTFFFLSYEREIVDPYLVQFFDDLDKEVRLWEPEAAGFMDTQIPAGKDWDAVLSGALRECRAFVSIYTPSYFEAEYCGKEWQAFQDRLKEYVGDSTDEERRNPGLSIPVLWMPERALLGRMPEVVPKIQFTETDFGPNYASLGLRQLMINDNYQDDYRTFVAKFAERLVTSARAHPLPVARNLRSLGSVENAFARKPRRDLGPLTGLGPRVVKFVLVAPSRSEASEAKLRDVLDCYGDEGGLSWKPYWDEVPVEAGLEAQRMANQWLLYSSAQTVTGDIGKFMEEAARQNNIVVIIVDAWSLRLDAYHELMREWNRFSYFNCVLLIPWSRDARTRSARALLVHKLIETFPTRVLVSQDDPELKITSLDQFCVMDGINTWDELIAALHDNLKSVRTRIAMITPYINRAGPGQPLPSIL